MRQSRSGIVIADDVLIGLVISALVSLGTAYIEAKYNKPIAKTAYIDVNNTQDVICIKKNDIIIKK